MIYKKAQRLTESLSAIGIGCWNFGGEWDRPDEATAIKIIHAAVDNGVNLFDVAPIYGKYKAEEVLGKALAEGKCRAKIMIASKCGLPIAEDGSVKNDLSYQSIINEAEGSLKRLQTDHIDIYQLHWPAPKMDLEYTAKALEALKKQGKIRYIGLSNFSAADVEKMMNMVGVDVQQSLYNMLERNTDTYHNISLAYRTEKDVLTAVRKYGQAFFPYSPLFQGLLAGKFKNGKRFSDTDVRNANPKFLGKKFEAYCACFEEINAIADELGHPVSDVALNWLRQKQEVTSIIAGVSSLEQLDRNLRSLEWNIPADFMEKIEEVIHPFENT